MTSRKRIFTGILSILGMLAFVLHSEATVNGAKEGLALCLYSVIPALFPFFVISGITNNALTGIPLKILRPLGFLCGVPEGCESLLLLGLTGGYPVGAKAIADAYSLGKITLSTAKRLLRFCNNAGPSFIFGLVAQSFTSQRIGWFIWLVHILSALIVGVLLSEKDHQIVNITSHHALSFSDILANSLKTMAIVCGYVVLFKSIINVCIEPFVSNLPLTQKVIISGILELTNGCCQLDSITNESSRFVLACCLLSSGGICVTFQTAAVIKDLKIYSFIHGKILHTAITFILASCLQDILFPNKMPLPFYIPLGITVVLILYVLCFKLKKSSIIRMFVV